ncbi:sensor histidine kinase [Facklamia sp. P12955]|uniref:sensor histidine kinase n=1 Tax=unclassified Facklamia TaxID=2622293 RepID=UPI003D17D379
MIYILWIFSLLGLYYWLEYRKKQRINELLQLIENMNKKNYTMPMKQDDFSMLEDGLYKLFIALVEAREQTVDNAQRQIEYLEDIAHQIKTPITSMQFSLETIEVQEASKSELLILKRQLLRLNTLSDILLKLSSLDAKEDPMKKETINLAELVEYASETVDFRRNVHFEVSDSLETLFIEGDFYWLAEAVTNILKNAYNRPLCNHIKIDSRRNPLFTSLTIQDNGGGIARENLKKIFRRFYKTPDSNGFGIGLAMAKSIVEKNKGEINVSNVENGAKFEIKFYNVT